MLGVAAFEFLGDGGVAVEPEAGEVFGDLDGAHVGGEELDEEGDAAGGDAGRFLLAVEVLDAGGDGGLGAVGVVDLGFASGGEVDALGGVAVEGLVLGVAEPGLEGGAGLSSLISL